MKEREPKQKSIKVFNGLVFAELLDFDGCPGVYIVFCEKGGKGKPIRRVHGTDRSGILYVGCSKDLLNRIYNHLEKR